MGTTGESRPTRSCGTTSYSNRPDMKPEILRRWQPILIAAVAVAIVFLTAYFLLPVVNSSKYRVIRDDRVAILKEIAAATRIYRERTGRTPKTLADLDGIKLRFAETRMYRQRRGATTKVRLGIKGDEYTFMADSLVEGGVVPYKYLPETCDPRNAHLARTVPLAYAATPDNAGRYYCVYLDGTVQRLTHADLHRRILILRNGGP